MFVSEKIAEMCSMNTNLCRRCHNNYPLKSKDYALKETLLYLTPYSHKLHLLNQLS